MALSGKSSGQCPAEIVVVDHLTGHATVHADVLSRDEARLVAGEKEDDVRDVEGIPDASGGMLAKLIASACVSAAMPPFAAV